MAFDFLKSSADTLEITLDRETYRPGDMIHARLTVKAEHEVKVRSGKIDFIGEERYEIYTRHPGSDGKMRDDYEWETNNLASIHKDFLGELTIGPNYSQSFDFQWHLPDNARPSIKGKAIVVTWLIKATLDRKLAVDTHLETSVPVVIPLPGAKPSQEDEVTTAQHNDVIISLRLPRSDWAAGETIAGMLDIQACNSLALSGIRAELVRKEFVPKDLGNDFEKRYPTQLAESTTLSAGETLSLPIQVNLPENALPTIITGGYEINWKMNIILARKMAADYQLMRPIHVFGSAA
jgi:sporulation-control protein spo0M